MANFELIISERAFENRNTKVNFDEKLYGELLEELVEVVPVNTNPIVNITPAPIWGASRFRRVVSQMAHNEHEWPASRYVDSTKSIKIRADQSAKATNQLLLHGTRCWSGDVNGQQATADELRRQKRGFRWGAFLATTGAATGAGYEIGGGNGALLGGVLGVTASLLAGVIDAYHEPYYKEIREFVKDPDTQAKYGQIISYASL